MRRHPRDVYRPADRPGPPEYGRDESYDFNYERLDRYGRMRRDGRPSRSPSPRDRRNVGQLHGRGNGEFNFRGAADADRRQRARPEETFTFRSLPPSAPRFPSRSPSPRERSPKPQTRRITNSRQGHGNNSSKPGLNGQRGDRRHAGRGRGGFVPRPAHRRDILHRARRGSTPEQLAGMNADGQRRFMNVDFSSKEVSDDDRVVDLTQESDVEESTETSRKRLKLDSSALDVEPPKWSNPDPYTSLPPPATLGAPKVDVVQLIRKAKISNDNAPQADSTNAVKNNVDFVSLNEASEEGEASDTSSARSSAPPVNAPSGPAIMRNRQTLNGKHKPPMAPGQAPLASPSRFDDLALDDGIGSPPKPPDALVMPTDEELIANYAGGPKGKKRKRGEQSRDLGSVVPEWLSDGSNPTPWCTSYHTQIATSSLRRLDQEIRDFYEFVRPYSHEDKVRMDLVNRIQSAVKDCPINGAKSVSVEYFGSFATALYLPTADMDLVAISDNYRLRGYKTFCQTHNPIRKLARHLETVGIAAPGTMSLVLHAKVPIIKFMDRRTGIKVDISFENDTGLTAVRTIKQWKEEHPAMPIVVLLIKQLLAMRGLNEVFTGGLGGFAIICLVVSMMQLTPEIRNGSMESPEYYTVLLLEFLDLYGNRIDITRTGINMNPLGYFDKIRHPARKQNDTNLTIIDPNNPSNDISGGSRNIHQVLAVFRSAHAELQRRLAQIDSGADADASVLGCILGGNYKSFTLQRNKLNSIHRGLEVPPLPAVPQRNHDPQPEQRLPRRYRRNQKIQSLQPSGPPLQPERNSSRRGR